MLDFVIILENYRGIQYGMKSMLLINEIESGRNSWMDKRGKVFLIWE